MKIYLLFLLLMTTAYFNCAGQHLKYGISVSPNITYLHCDQISRSKLYSIRNVNHPGYSAGLYFQYTFSKTNPFYLSIALAHKYTMVDQDFSGFNWTRNFKEKDHYLQIPFSVGCLLLRKTGIEIGFNYYRLSSYKITYALPEFSTYGKVSYMAYSTNQKEHPVKNGYYYTGISLMTANAFTLSAEINERLPISEKFCIIPFLKYEINGSRYGRGIDYGGPPPQSGPPYFTKFSSFDFGIKIIRIKANREEFAPL